MAPGVAALPTDLWIECLSFLSHADLARALCTCQALSKESVRAWRASCFRHWPRWASIAELSDCDWRRVTEFCCLRESERAVVIDPSAVLQHQDIIEDRHRAILAEWMCEVSFEWNLESSLVFDAVRFLDHFLKAQKVADLGWFQLIGLACLRVAIGNAAQQTSAMDCDDDKLHPARFASMSADTYTPEQVVEYTQIVGSCLKLDMIEPPNAKMFLRSFWQHALRHDIVQGDEMHLYTLASFFLQLGLLHLPVARFSPSQQAAAALSLSFSLFNRAGWPLQMQACGSYQEDDLVECILALMEAQTIRNADKLRRMWVSVYQGHGYQNCMEEWNFVLSIFGQSGHLNIRFSKTNVVENVLSLEKARSVHASAPCACEISSFGDLDATSESGSSHMSDSDTFQDISLYSDGRLF